MRNLFDQSYERAELIKTVFAANAPERITGRDISTITRAGTTRKVVVVTGDPHGYTNGARVYISSSGVAEFNTGARGALISVIDATSFAVFLDGTTALDNTGDGVCYADMFVRQATVVGMKAAQTNNTGNIRIGVASADGAQPYLITPGGEAYLNFGMPDESRINLASYYIDVVNAGDGAVVLYS